jgi:hypothetical protein
MKDGIDGAAGEPGRMNIGRHAEVVPMDGSHYVLVDGKQWSRHDDLTKAEGVRKMIIEGWEAYYDEKARLMDGDRGIER